MAGPVWPYLLALVGKGSSPSGGGVTGAAMGAAMAAPGATGGGGGIVVQSMSVTLQGISNPQEFVYELQNLLLSAAKGQGIPSLLGSF
jgi:hypothetical protein